MSYLTDTTNFYIQSSPGGRSPPFYGRQPITFSSPWMGGFYTPPLKPEKYWSDAEGFIDFTI